MALTQNKNFLSPVGFTFVIDGSTFANTEYFCTSVSMPGISMGAVDIGYKGVNLTATGDRMTFGSLSITFNITENMENYIEMYDWMLRVVNGKNAEDEKYDARLMVLSSHNNVSKEIKFEQVFLTELGGIEFNSKSTDIEYAQASATFSYTLFEFSK
tara:strand:+ start:1535 stop:2005 length:471 start_codon:yes stop_codon:yes gene_type:complete